MGFDVSDLFKEAFGLVPEFRVPGPPSISEVGDALGLSKGYNIPQRDGDHDVPVYQVSGKEESSADLYERQKDDVSWMDTQVMFPFWLGGERLKYFDEQTGELKHSDSNGRFLIPAATMVDFSRGKEVIKTSMSAGYGTIKELYSFGDWHIRLKGLLFDEKKSGRTAVELRRRLLSFEFFADSIPVAGWLFNEMKINRLVINSISLEQVQGKPWVIPFTMDCDSDEDLSLLMN